MASSGLIKRIALSDAPGRPAAAQWQQCAMHCASAAGALPRPEKTNALQIQIARSRRRDHAETLGRGDPEIIGKSPGPTGIVTAAQAASAVAALKAEIAQREARGQGEAAPTNADDARAQAEKDQVAHQELVSLRQRAAPFIELLERSAAAGKDVVWGV